MRALLTTLALCLTTPALAQGPNGTPIQAGQQYQGGTRVSAPAAGVAFTIPDGLQAEYDGEAHALIMGVPSQSNEILGVYAFSEGSLEEVGAVVLEALAEIGIQLRPREEPTQTGNTVRATYHAGTRAGQGVLLGAVRSGSPGNAMAVVALGPPEAEQRLRDRLEGVLESVQFTPPGAAQWRAQLGGVRLNYLGQASSYSPGGVGDGSYASESTRRYDFCSNGQYGYYMHRESYISVEGVGGMSSEETDEHQGQWTLVGDIVGGAWLILEATDGRVFEYQLEERENGVVVGEDIFEAARSPLCQ